MRKFILAALCAIAVSAGTAQAQEAPAGTWRGIGLQVDPGGKQSEWTLAISIKAGGAATIEYPSLKCGGVLLRIAPGKYRETITHGDCISGGEIAILQGKGKLYWTWTGEKTNAPDVSATAVLYAAGVA